MIFQILICAVLIVLGLINLADNDNMWGVLLTFIGLSNLIRVLRRRKNK